MQDGSDIRRVLLIGQPGYGKSMLLNKITLDWTDTVLSQDHDKTKNKDIMFTRTFDILIYIDLCKWAHNDTITDYLKIETDTENFHTFLQENSSKCLFILDSWDEFAWKDKEGQIAKLTNGDIFQESTVIIASKFMEKKILPDYKDKTCIIQGFSEKQAKAFVINMFGNDKILTTLGTELISDPFMLHAVCFLYRNDIPITVCLSRFFVEMVLCVINREKIRRKVTKRLSLNAYDKDLLSIGKLALAGLTKARNIKKVFSEEEANESETGVVGIGCDLGLLHRITHKSPRYPVQVAFPHRLLQEFLAAIYVANDTAGFEILENFLKSLIEVHDLQMLIIFISGLSNVKGYHFINKVIELSRQSSHYGDKCPEFCWAGWVSLDLQWDQLHARKADNITPFVLKCLWEMSREQERVFPFCKKETYSKQTVSLQPDLNFKVIPIEKVNELVELGDVKFDKGIAVRLYNLNDDISITEDSDISFSCLKERRPDILDVKNLKRNCRYTSFVEWLANQKQLVKFYMAVAYIPLVEMKAILKTIGLHVNMNLKTLFLKEVDLTDAEMELCETIRKLHFLYFFCLQNVTFAKTYAADICEEFAGKNTSPLLERLDLAGTNMSGAKDKLSKVIKCQSNLKELKLDDTDMTESQTKEVCSLLAGNKSLVSLGLSNNNLRDAIGSLTPKLNEMDHLKDLNVSETDITETQLLDLLQSIPQDMKALLTWQPKTFDKEYTIEVNIQNVKSLEVVHINLSEKQALCVFKDIEVCTEREWGSKRPKIADCLRKISKDYDRFTSEQLQKKKKQS